MIAHGPTGIVREQRIDAGYEGFALGVGAREMPADNLVGHRRKSTMRAFGALDAGLLADTAHLFVRTGGRVARPARLAALESTRIEVLAAAEEGAE